MSNRKYKKKIECIARNNKILLLNTIIQKYRKLHPIDIHPNNIPKRLDKRKFHFQVHKEGLSRTSNNPTRDLTPQNDPSGTCPALKLYAIELQQRVKLITNRKGRRKVDALPPIPPTTTTATTRHMLRIPKP